MPSKEIVGKNTAISGQVQQLRVVSADDLENLKRLRNDIQDCLSDNTWALEFYDAHNFDRELLELLINYTFILN